MDSSAAARRQADLVAADREGFEQALESAKRGLSNLQQRIIQYH